MRKNPSYTALLRPARLLISEKSATYTIKWSYTIIWQVRVGKIGKIVKIVKIGKMVKLGKLYFRRFVL